MDKMSRHVALFTRFKRQIPSMLDGSGLWILSLVYQARYDIFAYLFNGLALDLDQSNQSRSKIIYNIYYSPGLQ